MPTRDPFDDAPSEAGRVLIVDDEPGVRRILVRMLTGAGIEAVAVPDARRALEAANAGISPHIVLLDRSIPGLPAVELVARLRDVFPDSAILYYTGQGVPPDEASRVDGVLRKPLALSRLLEEIQPWLPKKPQPQDGTK